MICAAQLVFFGRQQLQTGRTGHRAWGRVHGATVSLRRMLKLDQRLRFCSDFGNFALYFCSFVRVPCISVARVQTALWT